MVVGSAAPGGLRLCSMYQNYHLFDVAPKVKDQEGIKETYILKLALRGSLSRRLEHSSKAKLKLIIL